MQVLTKGELTIPLLSAQGLKIRNSEPDFGFNRQDYAEQTTQWLDKGQPNGVVRLSVLSEIVENRI